MSEKYEEERKNLLYKNSNGYTVISEAERAEMEAYAKRYIAFLNAAKTEREAVRETIRQAEEKGFKPYTAGMALEQMYRRVGYEGFELVKAEHDTWIEAQYTEEGVNSDPLFDPLVDSPRAQELDSESWLACCEIVVRYANSIPRWELGGASAENTTLALNWESMKRQMKKAADDIAQEPAARTGEEYPHWTMPEPTISDGYASELDGDFLPLGFAIPHVAPNDPCPCGSGLRYCRCHGKYLS